MKERPTGIIRTLPSLGPEHIGKKRYEASLKALERGHDLMIHIALSAIPKVEVLHMYLLVGGEIQVRLNIAGYKPGDAHECWDGEIRQPKFWAVCTGPVSRPPETMKRRGFQGFRHTGDLW
jgi:hypothetical protein